MLFKSLWPLIRLLIAIYFYERDAVGIKELLSIPAMIIGAGCGPIVLFALFRLAVAACATIVTLVMGRPRMKPLLMQSKSHFMYLIGMLIPLPLIFSQTFSNFLLKKQLAIKPLYSIPLSFENRLWVECAILMIPIILITHHVAGLYRRKSFQELVIDTRFC